MPVGRTPLKQLVTHIKKKFFFKKACNFKRSPLLQHPVESMLVPVSLIYALFKKHSTSLKSKSIKVIKHHSKHLERNEAVMCTTESFDPSL